MPFRQQNNRVRVESLVFERIHALNNFLFFQVYNCIQTVIGVILCNPLDFPDEGLTIKTMQ